MNKCGLRTLIVRLQDCRSEDDRKRLHFFLKSDASLSGTLSLIESLFEQDKIHEDGFTFLLNAFDEIRCPDAVKLLRDYLLFYSMDEFQCSVTC